MPDTHFNLFYDEIYSTGLDPSARFPVSRYSKLRKKLLELDERKIIGWQKPCLANVNDLLLVHDEKYVQRFLSGNLEESEIRRIGLRPWKDAIVERTLRLTGGALDALGLVLSGHSISGNMAGGTHHAFRNAGAGYCIFNDLAICAEKALQQPEINRVLILDLDVHQGDGTADIFKDDDRVFTVSLHGRNNFPFRKKVSNLDIAFENDTEDDLYLSNLEKVLNKLKAIPFDLIFYQAGVDGLTSDALGLLSLTREGLRERNRQVLKWRKELNLPLLVFMGGGYSRPIESTVDAFSDLFIQVAREVLETKGTN